MSRPPVYITGAAAVSAFGFEWRGLGDAIERRSLSFSTSTQLAESHPGTLASEVPPFPSWVDKADARVRKLMSRGARLSSIAVKQVLDDARWEQGREEVGFFCGVGDSGGTTTELTEMLRASISEKDGPQFSLTRFGSEGLAACNPLFAFQLMNNFTLCHGAILNGVGGPNSAIYSRGIGTVAALAEASHALLEGDCRRALAGGSDSALHPVTWAELVRQGYSEQGLNPGEGAGFLALEVESERPLALLEHCDFRGPETPVVEFLQWLVEDFENPIDRIVIAPWGKPARTELRNAGGLCFPEVPILDVSEIIGDSLAAFPALAWIAALDLLVSEKAKSTLVLSVGTDGGIGSVLMRSAS